MNPDYTAETIIWTLKSADGKTATFQVRGKKVWVEAGHEYVCHSKESARHIWYNYIGMGYSVVNKCIDHDMGKFYDAKRKEESRYEYNEYKEAIDDYMLSHKKQYAKKAYEEAMDRYALEA